MRIKQYIYLYKTKLDKLYSNVICPIQSNYTDYTPNDIKDRYFYLIDSSATFGEGYDKTTIELDTARGLKIYNDNSAVLTIKYAREDVKKFNYVVMTDTNNTKVFYFIDNIISLNDNPSNPSCSVHLKYDSWANNLDKIRGNSIFGTLNNGHIKNFEYNNTIKSLNVNIENGEQPYSYTNKFGTPRDDGYRILYYKMIANESKNEEIVSVGAFTIKEDTASIVVTTSDGVVLPDITTIFPPPYKTKSFFDNIYGVSVYYIPVKLYNKDLIDLGATEDVVFRSHFDIPRTESTMGVDFGEHTFTYKHEDSVDLFQIFNSYTKNCYLTYYAPFDFTVSKEDDKWCVDFIDCDMNIVTDFSDNIDVPVISHLNTLVGTDTHGAVINNRIVENYFYNNGMKRRLRYDFNLNNYDSLVSGDDNFDKNDKCSTSHYKEPLKSYLLKINDDIIDLSSNKYNELDFTVTVNLDTVTPKVSIIGNVSPFAQSFAYLTKRQDVSYSIDALDDYLIRNGAQLAISKDIAKISKRKIVTSGVLDTIKDSISSVVNVANSKSTGEAIANGVIGVIDTAENITSLVSDSKIAQRKIDLFNAKEKDLSNTPSVSNGDFGEGDLYADLIYVIECKQLNDITAKSIISKEFRYGQNQLLFVNANEIVSTYFDYKQFSNIDFITTGIDGVSMDELKAIYKRGITIHYVRTNYKGDNALAKGISPDNIVNVNKEFRIDQNYINANGGIVI